MAVWSFRITFVNSRPTYYISEEASFESYMWAATPDISIQTTNSAESFHGHINAQFFYSAHPNIYVFVETLLRTQVSKYITITSANHGINNNRKSSEKTALNSYHCTTTIVLVV